MLQSDFISTNPVPAPAIIPGSASISDFAPVLSSLASESPLSTNGHSNSTGFSEADFSPWQYDPLDGSKRVLHARHFPSGFLVVRRMFPELAAKDQKQELRQRLKLIQWLGPKFGADNLEDLLDQTPPAIQAYFPELDSFDSWLPKANVIQRLRLAHDLIDTIDRAHAAGLLHGSLNNDCVKLDHYGLCRIDYLMTLSRSQIETEMGSIDKDLLALLNLVQQLLGGSPENETWMKNLSGQHRTRLLRLLKRSSDTEDVHETVSRWRELLCELRAKDSVSETNPQIADQAPPNQRKIQLPSSTSSVSPQSIANQLVPTDQTCEIEPPRNQVKPFVEPRTDQSTSVLVLAKSECSALSAPKLPQPGDILGRFQLVKQIGQGGMGVVFEGLDLATHQKVAIKILHVAHGDVAHAVRRFRKEARLLQGIRNDFVTQLIEIGVAGDIHYLAMEFVEGTNLREWLSARNELDEPNALRLVADIARALTDAHHQEIIHRDIKPENVLLAKQIKTDIPAEDLELTQLRVKLSDFGIARQVRQTQSMEMTRAGAMIGTPTYMSPEQCKSSKEIGPTSDVYSLGVLLYRLLVGALPFESDDPIKLLAMHCFDCPPSLQKRNRAISDATAELVLRMLAKDPMQRPADASQVVSEIERLLSGDPSPFEAHPRLPVASENRVWKRVFQWELASSASDLWPLVSNTERLNRAIGLQSVKYRTEKDPKQGLRKFGSFKLAGMNIEWEEHPFEWIEGSRMGILREFASGPFRWFSSVVELISQPSGGTRLIHTVRIESRNFLGKMVAEIEAGWKGGKSLDRVYRRIDNWIQKSQKQAMVDPYETSPRLSRESERRLMQRLEHVIDQGVSPELGAKLGDYLRTAAPQTLAQIRPLDLAEILNEPSDVVIDACLLAARNQLLVMRWDILCPTCRAPASTVSWLNEVNEHTGCEACDTEFQSNLANAIELVFQVHPDIRQADTGKYCVGGPEHSPHVVTQLRLAPGERIEVVVPLAIGDYLLRGPRLSRSLAVRARARAAPSHLDVRLSYLTTTNHTPVVRTGQVSVQLTNDFDTSQVVRIERTIDRSNVVTAAMASALSRFRELFPDQVFRRDIPVSIEELTFLAVRIVRAEQLYLRCSEADAYLLIQKSLAAIEECVLAYQGAVVKSVGETLLATFHNCIEAAQAALETTSRIREMPELQNVEVSCGVHRGSALVTTQNGRLDYFGNTTRIVQALAVDTQPTIALSDAVFTDPDVNRWLETVRAERANFAEQIQAIKIPCSTPQLVKVISTNHQQMEQYP